MNPKIPYWQAREYAVRADVSVDTMRRVLDGAVLSSRARRRAKEWLQAHGFLHLIAAEPREGVPSQKSLASARLRAKWQDPEYRAQMVARGRAGKGVQPKLTAEMVREARALYATGQWSYPLLAERYGVNRTAIGDAVRGRSWRDVR